MTYRVLIAEGESWAADLLSSVAVRLGYAVRLASDGVQALEAYREFSPDLVIIDHMLPKFDGLGVAGRIRASEAGRAIPMILVSAIFEHSGETMASLHKRYGFANLIEKPFDEERIEAILRAYLEDEEEERSGEHAVLASVDVVPDNPEEALGGKSTPEIFLELFRTKATEHATHFALDGEANFEVRPAGPFLRDDVSFGLVICSRAGDLRPLEYVPAVVGAGAPLSSGRL